MDIPLRVLMIEDSDRDVALEVRALKSAGYQVTYAVAETAVEMKAALAEQVFDIVISDNDMPQFDAQGALAVLKQSGLDIPFIIVSGAIGEEIAGALMKAGANRSCLRGPRVLLISEAGNEIPQRTQ
jgi:DNA-binding NtrC family response regulator